MQLLLTPWCRFGWGNGDPEKQLASRAQTVKCDSELCFWPLADYLSQGHDPFTKQELTENLLCAEPSLWGTSRGKLSWLVETADYGLPVEQLILAGIWQHKLDLHFCDGQEGDSVFCGSEGFAKVVLVHKPADWDLGALTEGRSTRH